MKNGKCTGIAKIVKILMLNRVFRFIEVVPIIGENSGSWLGFLVLSLSSHPIIIIRSVILGIIHGIDLSLGMKIRKITGCLG